MLDRILPAWLLSRTAALGLITLAAWGMFGAALVSEHVFGLLPCQLCRYQQYVHFGIGVIGLLLMRRKDTSALLLMCLLYVGSGLLGAYHVGVQHKIFPMPPQCSQPVKSSSIEELRAKLLNRPAVRCDKPAVLIFGLSFAAYNAIISLLIATYAGMVYRRDDNSN